METFAAVAFIVAFAFFVGYKVAKKGKKGDGYREPSDNQRER